MTVRWSFVVLALLTAPVFLWSSSSAQQSGPDVRANINDDCIQGENWPAQASVDVTVRDSAGGVLHRFTNEQADSRGHISVAQRGELCDTPVDLRPGMEVTGTDGDTRKVLVLAGISFDSLDPITDTAFGRAPPGPVGISIYRNVQDAVLEAELEDEADANGDWSADIGKAGGDVREQGWGDVYVSDPDGDFTFADHFGTAVSLDVTVPPAASSATVVERGTRVRLNGRLSAGQTACVARKRVRLVKVRGKRATILRRGRTRRNGHYAFNRRVRKTASFRVEYRGNRRCQRSKSRVREVRVSG